MTISLEATAQMVVALLFTTFEAILRARLTGIYSYPMNDEVDMHGVLDLAG
jgi:hypothetical protein